MIFCIIINLSQIRNPQMDGKQQKRCAKTISLMPVIQGGAVMQ